MTDDTITPGSDPETDGPNLGKDGTIPNSDTGLAVGHDPDGSHFNQEEEAEESTE